MRHRRRVSFAAPFVMVVGTLAACGAPKPSPVHDNPPSPLPPKRTVEQCQQIVAETPCEGAESCQTETDCGSGFKCRDGKWQRAEMACNPPPP